MPNNNQVVQLGTLDKTRLDDESYVQNFVRGRCAQANIDLSVSRISVSRQTGMMVAELLPVKVRFTD